MNTVCLMIGSNIEPVENTQRALQLLAEQVDITAISTTWETKSVGYDGPNFLNTAICIQTLLDSETLKREVLGKIEQTLGRVRSENKNAPRTIDIDIILENDGVVDTAVWRQSFLALPISELYPNLHHSETGKTLREIAAEFYPDSYAVRRFDLRFSQNKGRNRNQSGDSLVV